MKSKISAFIVIGLLLFSALLVLGARDILYNPIIRGIPSGVPFAMTFRVENDVAADRWLLGDTTAAGMYIPEQPLQVIDVKVFGDPDDGDSVRVFVYDCAAGTGVAQIAATSDTLSGTAEQFEEDATISGTYKTITAAEGMAINLDYIAGTIDWDITVVVEFELRQTDAYE